MDVIKTGICKPWSPLKRSIFTLSVEILKPSIILDDSCISLSFECLKYGDIGNSLYDLIIDFTLNKREDYSTRIAKGIEWFCNKYTDYDYIITMRRILLNKSGDSFEGSTLSTFNTALMKINSLIMSGFNKGQLSGIQNKQVKYSIKSTEDIYGLMSVDIIDLNLYIYAELVSRGRSISVKNIETGETQPLLRLSKSKISQIKSHSEYTYGRFVFKVLSTISESDLRTILNNISESVLVSNTVLLYNEVSDNYNNEQEIFRTLMWERENTVNLGSSLITSVYDLLINSLSHHDLLKHRRIYVRDKGVTLKIKDNFDGLDSIFIIEYHNTDLEEHYILVSYKVVNNSLGDYAVRNLIIDIKDIKLSYVFVLYEKDMSVLLFIFAWLSVLDKINISIEALLNLNINGWDEDSAITIQTTIKELIKSYNEECSEDNISYEVPYSWNYDNFKPTKNPENQKGTKLLEKTISVGRYTRRLPQGQSASDEARELAKKYLIDLEEGYTLVDEFERKQKFGSYKNSTDLFK